MTNVRHDSEIAIHPGVSIGHVNLKVGDLDRSLRFWCGVLGFRVNQRRPGCAFVAAGNYDTRAFFCKSQRGCPADSRKCAGDQNNR